jgi:pyridoxal phosphate enzyme (YggS family)
MSRHSHSVTADTLCQRLEAARRRIALAAERAGRVPDSVTLVAVSKTKPASLLRAAWHCGQRRFGENYVQEAIPKIEALDDLAPEWHFIGPIQSNKTAAIAGRFDWVHSIDRIKIARRLSAQRPSALPPLQCCLQVNVSGETTKAGLAIGRVAELAAIVAELPGLCLRGLMAIPARAADIEAQRRDFRRVYTEFESLRARGFVLDTLSMGMSADLETAIAEGATLVRVGTAIFGPRQPHP